MSSKQCPEVIYIRHNFRGISNTIGFTEVILNGACPGVLQVPAVLSSQYNEESLSCGLKLRANTISKCLNSCFNVLADFASQRTFITARTIALASKICKMIGAPTS